MLTSLAIFSAAPELPAQLVNIFVSEAPLGSALARALHVKRSLESLAEVPASRLPKLPGKMTWTCSTCSAGNSRYRQLVPLRDVQCSMLDQAAIIPA